MRELREQSLRQIQNWDFVRRDYEMKLQKKREEELKNNPKGVNPTYRPG